MDKTVEYQTIKDNVEYLINDEIICADNTTLCTFLQLLREQLVPELETENDGAIHGRNNIPDEVLRKYVSITKEIRAFWFDNIDTHLLTIERLADQTVARRRAYERARNKTVGQNVTPSNIKNDGGSTKATVTKAPVNKTADLLSDLAKLSPEEIAKVLASIGKK